LTAKGFERGEPWDGSSDFTMAYIYDFLDILLLLSENGILAEKVD
jgi:hypothetical protein